MAATIVVSAVLALLSLVAIGLAFRGQLNALFLALVALTLVVVGIAVVRDTQARDYISIQQQYLADHPVCAPGGSTQGCDLNPWDIKVQQVFPQFAGAKVGDSFRVERCISCHVPNLDAIGPQTAAQRLACDFFKYEPDSKHLAKSDGLNSFVSNSGSCISAHPTVIDQSYYAQYGPSGTVMDAKTGKPLVPADPKAAPITMPGFLPPNADPNTPANAGKTLGIDTVGCIVCHNGNRLALTEQDAHQNLIVNPQYSWSAGAALYYQQCATCHNYDGSGGLGPPLNNQDRLGFFNEDYYYRCIEYGMTDFEHYGSIMPNWGSIASDYNAAEHPPGQVAPGQSATVNKQRVLSEDQIQLLIQFIRHWQSYDTTP
jgi:hypothetical protein